MYSGDGEQAGRTAEMGGRMFSTFLMNGRLVTIMLKLAVWVATLVRRLSDWC